jgi:DNA replication and repair protein RecF
MRVLHLALDQFRAYHELRLDLPDVGLRLYGENASGKTSLLEAIYLLATARSGRATVEREMINWESNQEFGLAPYARVVGAVEGSDGARELEVALLAETERTNATRKRIKIDGVPRRAVDLVGILKAVLFSPEDLNLVLGSPAARRRYFDITISQVDRTYIQALARYGRIIEQRNSLLKALATSSERRSPGEELSYWDEQLVRYGAYILAARLRYVDRLGVGAGEAFAALSAAPVALALEYVSSLDVPGPQIERMRMSNLAEAQQMAGRAIETGLRTRRKDELRRGATLIGPHRDDLRFMVGGRDLAAFGSRGQQRLAVVAAKLAELRQILTLSGDAPVLLLDDVLSELDRIHQDRLLEAISDAQCQIIVTGTERGLLEHPALARLPMARAGEGTIAVEK